MTQKERQERSKREILQAAMEEFGNCGYEKVTVESICSRHGISKGMMYHYYSNKDELFLLCVQKTFQELKIYVDQQAADLADQSTIDTIKNFFMIREYYFQLHPEQKLIFENALIRPPKDLADQIRAMRKPIRETNRKFLSRIVSRMTLRPGLDPEKVTHYLEGMGEHFWSIAAHCGSEEPYYDIHSMLEAAEELLDMTLFGVLQQTSAEKTMKD